MKLSIISLFVLLLSSVIAHGQDIIKTRSGTILRGKVTNVTSTTITYKADTADSLVTVNISELAGINYANGTKEVFETTTNAATGEYSTATLMHMGQQDAQYNYKDYRSAKTATTVVTAICIPYGLIPAIACSSIRPSEYNLGQMNYELKNNSIYRDSYELEARNIKRRQVWKGFGNGALIAGAYYIVLSGIVALTLMH